MSASQKKKDDHQDGSNDNDQNNQVALNQRESSQHREIQQVDFAQSHQLQQIPLQVVDSNGTPFMIAPEVLANLEAMGG